MCVWLRNKGRYGTTCRCLLFEKVVQLGAVRGREHDPHQPDEQGFIPGVFNYCDRWCEKCGFVRQCRVGAIDVDDISEDNEEVASEKVEGYEDRLKRMMDDMPGREGTDDEDDDPIPDLSNMDLSLSPEEEEEYERKEEEVTQKLDEHALTNLGTTYMDMVSEWLEEHHDGFVALGIDLHKRTNLRMVPLSPELLVLAEALDEVVWFHTMVPVKTNRAMRGKIEDPHMMEELGMDPMQSDHNGTAKLVLLMLQRCNIAWETITDLEPRLADGVVPMQELLRRHEVLMREEFPDAMRFVRPGFDAPGR